MPSFIPPPIHITGGGLTAMKWIGGGESNVFLLHHLCDLTSISKIFSLNSMNIIFFEKGITFSMMLRNLVTLNSIQFLFLMRYPHSKYLIRPRTNCSYISCWVNLYSNCTKTPSPLRGLLTPWEQGSGGGGNLFCENQFPPPKRPPSGVVLSVASLTRLVFVENWFSCFGIFYLN